MASYIYCILSMLVVFVCEQMFVRAACPGGAQAEVKAKKCLKDVGMDVDAMKSGAPMANMDQIKVHCANKAFDGAMTCLQGVMDECKDDETASNAINNLFNLDKMRSALKMLCDNIDVIEEKGMCYAQQSEPLSKCVMAELQKMQKKQEAMQSSGQASMEDMMKLSCGLLDGMVSCQRSAFQPCGKKAVDFMIAMTTTVTPRICADSSVNALVASSTSIFLALFVAIFLHFK